jgi:hypothetical protein
MGNVLPKKIQSDLCGYAEALTAKGRPAKAMQLGEYPYVVLLGERFDRALDHIAACVVAKGGDLLQQNTKLSAAVVYYQRTGRKLSDEAGKAVLSPEQIAALDALIRWG